MILNRVFERFAQFSPVTVMMRGLLEYALPAKQMDELFRTHAVRQHEDELLFSTVVNTLSLAVTGVRKSVHAAYLASQEDFQVSVTSLYNKLQGVETRVSRALVRESAARLIPVVRELGGLPPVLIPGYRVKILDGNHLTGTEHRLQETRVLHSCPLPGQALVILDPQLHLMIDVFPCEDAYAQERSLLPEVLQTVEANDLWIADRNFCTTDVLFGLARRGAAFLIRQHASTLCEKTLLGRRKRVGASDTGVIYEQRMRISNPAESDPAKRELELRRITIELTEPTRDGETQIHVVTNVPWQRATALQLAGGYRQRWSIESAFQELEQSLRSEVDTLCYPKAALLAFCVAVLTSNVLNVLKAAVRTSQRAPALRNELSSYYLAEEISATYGGMVIAIKRSEWQRVFADLTVRELAELLKQLAKNVDASRFCKRHRGPKKPPPKRTGGMREKHVSTARILLERTEKPKKQNKQKTKTRSKLLA